MATAVAAEALAASAGAGEKVRKRAADKATSFREAEMQAKKARTKIMNKINVCVAIGSSLLAQFGSTWKRRVATQEAGQHGVYQPRYFHHPDYLGSVGLRRLSCFVCVLPGPPQPNQQYYEHSPPNAAGIIVKMRTVYLHLGRLGTAVEIFAQGPPQGTDKKGNRLELFCWPSSNAVCASTITLVSPCSHSRWGRQQSAP